VADPFEQVDGIVNAAAPVEIPEIPESAGDDFASRAKKIGVQVIPSAAVEEKPIAVRAGKIDAIVNEAIAKLLAGKVPFFQRGGEVVTPVVEDVAAFRGRRTKVVRLKIVSADLMRSELSRIAKWVKFDKRVKGPDGSLGCDVACDPPLEVARTILDKSERFRRLAGVITTPTLRPDGTLLCAAGYDEATGLLLVDPPPLPEIPERPTREDALAQLAVLDELLDEFCFADEPSRGVALSGLMTPVLRGGMLVAPLHAATAPAPGTGKTFWIDIASTISTGEMAAVIAAGRNEEETEKRLSAELMEGQPIISIDNLNGDLRGDFLCQIIERPIIKSRILGQSENRRIENTVTMFGNGNNLRTVADLDRRVVICSLDANLERPELRQFKRNPLEIIRRDRGKYIAAPLIIAKAYLAAGCPNLSAPVASFDDWTRLVRSPLVWLGCADPARTMETARAEDPELVVLEATGAAWWRVGTHKELPDGVKVKNGPLSGKLKPMTTGELIAFAADFSWNGVAGSLDECKQTLFSALKEFAPGEKARSDVDSRELGKLLGRNKNKIISVSGQGTEAIRVKVIGEKNKSTKQIEWMLQATNSVSGGGD
jgi:putative DNA primase/helicase